MIRPERPEGAALAAVGAAAALAAAGPAGQSLWMLLLVPLLGGLRIGRDPLRFSAFALAILLAGLGLISLRQFGLLWPLFLLLVVIATDVAGYFAGRLLGGPKFWPRISPKKTWSGTIAGWLCAALVGGVFAAAKLLPEGGWLILLAVLLSFASQMGDIAQSAMKRRAGIKDSSDLIPGHGGVFDRFDGVVGAALLMACLIMGPWGWL